MSGRGELTLIIFLLHWLLVEFGRWDDWTGKAPVRPRSRP